MWNRPTTWFKRHPIITGIIIFIIVAGIAGAAGDNKSSDSTPTTPTTAQTEQTTTLEKTTEAVKPTAAPVQAEKIELAKLIDAFDENQLAAEEQYKGS